MTPIARAAPRLRGDGAPRRREPSTRPPTRSRASSGKVLPAGSSRTLSSGYLVGHALHPLLTDVPIGMWTSALTLDRVGGRGRRRGGRPADPRRARRRRTDDPRRAGRTGPTPSPATTPSSASASCTRRPTRTGGALPAPTGPQARPRGAGKLSGSPPRARWARAASSAGLCPTRRASGSTRDDLRAPPTATGRRARRDASLADGEPLLADVGGIPVIVVRDGGEVFALSDRCAHRGGPLHEGTIENGCIPARCTTACSACATAGSSHGPSAYPQPAWEARVRAGRDRGPPASRVGSAGDARTARAAAPAAAPRPADRAGRRAARRSGWRSSSCASTARSPPACNCSSSPPARRRARRSGYRRPTRRAARRPTSRCCSSAGCCCSTRRCCGSRTRSAPICTTSAPGTIVWTGALMTAVSAWTAAPATPRSAR